MTAINYVEVLATAFASPVVAETISGCGRVYVAVTSEDKEHVKGIKRACKKLGKIFQVRSHYGDRNAIYVGYDNATGVELAKGTAIVAALKAAGIDAYRNEHGD